MQGNNSSKLVEDNRVKEFNKRFGDLADTWGTIASLPAGKVEVRTTSHVPRPTSHVKEQKTHIDSKSAH